RDLNDTVSEAALLRGMGNVYGNMGDYAEAITHFQEALTRFESLGMTEQLEKLRENIALAKQLRDGS
ncbi:MAG: tetratricopeptide repeat protein, partial [Chloroflexota bacterium]